MAFESNLPVIIQGGMGVGVSSWLLARAVSRSGQLGVVSGTSCNTVLIRRLQDGDAGGHVRRALERFPDQEFARKIVDLYFLNDGRPETQAYKLSPLPSARSSAFLQQLIALSTFVEIVLAKEGHDGLVGINFLEKLQLFNLPAIYGAMLADVDYILMGAGIPREIPGVLDSFSRNESASIKVTVVDAGSEPDVRAVFDPAMIFPTLMRHQLKRPKFLAIVSSATLAMHLAKKSTGKVDGFVIEGHSAGGHNAPPRGPVNRNEIGEPIYGVKDIPDLETIRGLGLPFWLAGSYGSPEKLKEAKASGAVGVQVGTAFAFCDESGFSNPLKKAVIRKWALEQNELSPGKTFTDPTASPTDFPFKVIPLEGTLSEKARYDERPRKCDLGYLRQVARGENGNLIYRCPSEPVDEYVRKGGLEAETEGRKCLCNALLANIALEQHQSDEYSEEPLITTGDDLKCLSQVLAHLGGGRESYSAQDVVDYLLS